MVALIDSPLTLKQAIKGLYLSSTVVRRQGHILIIDTRGETSSMSGLVKSSNYKIPTALSFSGSRWMGGSLTNWDSISIMVRRCAQISKQFDGFLAQNRIHIPRYEKMREAYPGFIKTSLCFKRGPDLLWVINPTENKHIIQEANRLNIPIIGLVDSNTDLSNITIPIPINTNTLFQSNKLITTLLALSNSLSTDNRKVC
jgi:small subunit ribosomal protein S2